MFLGERIWTEVPALTSKVVVVPLGSLEQHGHHLPILTDSMIGGEIARRMEQELGDAALFTPMVWTGASDHHLAMPGTISVSNDVYVKLISDILESLIRAGFRKIFLMNSHGGNITPGRMAIYNTHLKHRDKLDLFIAFGSWFDIVGAQIREMKTLETPMVTHACELETSMILSLRPELVKMEFAKGAAVPFESAFYSPDWTKPNRIDVPRAFDQISITGAFGKPEAGTPKKGVDLFDLAVEEITAFVREFAEWKAYPPA